MFPNWENVSLSALCVKCESQKEEAETGEKKEPAVNLLGQVLDEDVADSGFALGGVTMLPHDADRTATDRLVVDRVKGTLGCPTKGNSKWPFHATEAHRQPRCGS